jgi:predicted kinase
MLIALAGLPGSGKTTIAKSLARRIRALYIRVDEIEFALSRSIGPEVGGIGYEVGYAVASSNLKLGLDVIADSVNPLAVTRQGWRGAAIQAARPFIDVEILCGDPLEHRRRVEDRKADIAGFSLPTWPEVLARRYEPFEAADLSLDTAQMDPATAVQRIVALLDARRDAGPSDRRFEIPGDRPSD